jgi:hypothetical protein
MLYYGGPGEQRHYDAEDNYTGRTVRSHSLLRVLWMLIVCTVAAGWPLVLGTNYLGLTALSIWLLILFAWSLCRMAGQGSTSGDHRPERPPTPSSEPRRYRISEPGPRDWQPPADSS